MPRIPKKAERVEIKIRAATYRRIQRLARESGEKVGTLADAVIARWLDDKARRN